VVFKNLEDTQKVNSIRNFKINDRDITCTPYEPKEQSSGKNTKAEDLPEFEDEIQRKERDTAVK
jgi:hypothetical protein